MKVTRRKDSGGLLPGLGGLGQCFLDDVLGKVAAAAALELAADGAIGTIGVARPAMDGGADVRGANQIARANDHGTLITR